VTLVCFFKFLGSQCSADSSCSTQLMVDPAGTLTITLFLSYAIIVSLPFHCWRGEVECFHCEDSFLSSGSKFLIHGWQFYPKIVHLQSHNDEAVLLHSSCELLSGLNFCVQFLKYLAPMYGEKHISETQIMGTCVFAHLTQWHKFGCLEVLPLSWTPGWTQSKEV
jgi:hypothetical protein